MSSKSIRSLQSISGLILLCIFLAFFIAYSDTLKDEWRYWIIEENWQFLIPIAFVYMLWERRDLLIKPTYNPNPLIGSPLLILGCVILIAGQISSTHNLRELSIIINVFALAFLLFGTDFVRKLFWPLAYLILMTSLPSDLLEQLRGPMKLASAIVSAEILQAAGYVVYREATFLYLPKIVLEVADNCSGLNQLMSSIALGIPIAFTMFTKWWKQAFIIVVSIVFGIVMNWVRVVLISIWHYDSAKESIHGPYEIYELPFIFLIGVIFTLLIAFAIAEKNNTSSRVLETPLANPFPELLATRSFKVAAFSGMLILVSSAVYVHIWKATPVDMLLSPKNFPMSISGFWGQTIERLEKPFYSDLADDEFIAEYKNTLNEMAVIYIGYFRSQNQEKELVDYRYNWLHKGSEITEMKVGSQTIPMKRKVVNYQGKIRTVFFYFDINGRNIIDLKRAKLASLVDAVTRKRNNGAIIIAMFNGEKSGLSDNEKRFFNELLLNTQQMLPK